MHIHFSSIGFNFQSEEQFQETILRAVNHAKEVPVEQGYYLRWSSASGAELWLQADKDRNVYAMRPHFNGTSRVRVGLVKSVLREGYSPLDGALYAWANPTGDEPTKGDYPFIFEMPNYMVHAPISLPAVVTAQISAFAHELRVYESEAAYDSAELPEPRFASRSFIPAGLFPVAEGKDAPPPSLAIFTGHILQSEQRVNELTGNPFYWLSVDTLGGTFDVVVDPELTAELPPVGGILQGQFWLTGTPIDLPIKKSSYQKVWGFLSGQGKVN